MVTRNKDGDTGGSKKAKGSKRRRKPQVAPGCLFEGGGVGRDLSFAREVSGRGVSDGEASPRGLYAFNHP